jgi:hypothetical protein
MMQNADRFANEWRFFLTGFMIAARRASLWLLPTAVLALALGVGAPFPASVVQAQDAGTGQEATVSYQLTVNTGSLNLDRFCVGRIVQLPVIVSRNVQVGGNTSAGSASVLGVSYGASSRNAGVLTAGIDTASDLPLQNTLILRGIRPGTTTVSVRADIESEQRNISLYKTLQIRVVPCKVMVQMSTAWTTTMRSSSVVLYASIPGATLTLPENAIALAPEVNATLNWDATANRIRGCEGVSSQRTRDFASTVVQLYENSISVDIVFNPQAATTLFGCNRPFTLGRCDPTHNEGLPDGMCYPELSPSDMWSAGRLKVELPLAGGTKTVDLPLTHAGGTPIGKATVTVTIIQTE